MICFTYIVVIIIVSLVHIHDLIDTKLKEIEKIVK